MPDHRAGVAGGHARDGVGGQDDRAAAVDRVEHVVGDGHVGRHAGHDQRAAAEVAQQRVDVGALDRGQAAQPADDEVLVGHLDGGGDPDGGTAGQPAHREAFGGAEQPGVAAGAPAVRPAFGHGVDDLDAARAGGVDELGDPGEGAGGADLGGEFGQGAERCVRRHGSPWSSAAGRVRVVTVACGGKTTHPFLT